MSRGTFFFTSTALRSLELDKEELERNRHKTQLASHHLTTYMQRKESVNRTSWRTSFVQRPLLCQDVVIQNAVYTGNLEALQRLFPRGSIANVVIEPQGGDMRWVARGEGKRRCVSTGSFIASLDDQI